MAVQPRREGTNESLRGCWRRRLEGLAWIGVGGSWHARAHPISARVLLSVSVGWVQELGSLMDQMGWSVEDEAAWMEFD